jgi:transposase-like protein/IS1 family transposase
MTCHNCRIDAPKHGKHRNGLQRYRCNQCSKTFTEAHEEAFRVEDHLQDAKGLLALQVLTEGGSVRSAERISGLHRNTILQLLQIAGKRCERLLSEKIRNVPAKDVQVDEIWGFVGKKEKQRRPDDDPGMGDAWCFVGIERHCKLVLCWHLGRRDVKAAMSMMQKLSLATSNEERFQLTTDGMQAYPYAVGMRLDDRCDYATLIKVYAQAPEEERRYSPPVVVETIATPVYGDPDEARICTSHIERHNLSTRMSMRRMTRLTNGFSKKWENLKAAYALWFAFYNFCRKHITLGGKTPAMAAGIADHVWSVRELLEA